MATETRYVVKTSAACMPANCWGRYARVAVLEVEADAPEPKMISERAKGVVKVVATWEALNVGKTERCAYQRALAEAEDLAETLNAENQVALAA